MENIEKDRDLIKDKNDVIGTLEGELKARNISIRDFKDQIRKLVDNSKRLIKRVTDEFIRKRNTELMMNNTKIFEMEMKLDKISKYDLKEYVKNFLLMWKSKNL